MNISYNNFTTATGSWTGTPTAPYQYKSISSNINLSADDSVIVFNNLPVGMTVAESPVRTDPKDRAIAQIAITNENEDNSPSWSEYTAWPFRVPLNIQISRINCISGSRNLYQNYLAPVDFLSIQKWVSVSPDITSDLSSPYNNTSNISGCIMYEYINNNISGSIFLTGNGTGYIHTGYNSFIFSSNKGSYIADYNGQFINFQNPPNPLNKYRSLLAAFFPDEILSSYTKLSDNSIKVGYDLEGVSSSLSRLHVLFNRP
jgi:hypothetical protein